MKRERGVFTARRWWLESAGASWIKHFTRSSRIADEERSLNNLFTVTTITKINHCLVAADISVSPSVTRDMEALDSIFSCGLVQCSAHFTNTTSETSFCIMSS